MRIFVLITLFFISAATTLGAFDSAESAKNKELRILRVTPEGEEAVQAGRQIVIQFNRPVVPLGRMDRDSSEIPVEIEPKLQCEWRWLNASALSCNLDEKNAIKDATSYKVIINPGIKAEDGSTIAEAFRHQFTTQRPDVIYTWFRKWLSPSIPSLRLTFNQPVTKKSVQSSLFIVASDPGRKDKNFAAKIEPDPEDRDLPSYPPISSQNEAQKIDKDEEARRVWIITPDNELPLDSSFILKIQTGLVSALGSEKGISNRELIRFHTFPEFSFLGIRCYTNDDDSNSVLITPNIETQKLCNPMRGAAMVFSSPVFRSQIKNNILFSPRLDINSSSDIWANNGDYSSLWQEHQKDGTYEIWLPVGLKAAADFSLKTQNPEKSKGIGQLGLQDEFGRSLKEPIDINFRTNHRKPNFEIIHNNAVLEAKIESEIPLYVNNLNKITFNYRKLSPNGAEAGISSIQEIPNVQDVQFAIPFKIRQMLAGKSGAVYGELSTEPLVTKSPNSHRLFAQVTPYQLHVKLGHFNSTVWVTDLATGQPVDDAKVSIYKDKLTELNADKAVLSEAVTSSDGVAILDGMEKLDPMLDLPNSWQDEYDKLFVRVDKDGEMAIMPISYNFIIDSYRSVGESVFYNTKKRYGHIVTWGTTAQGIYRIGDTMQYKLYVRDHDNRTLAAAPKNGYNLKIIDPTGNKVHEIKELSLNEFGSYSGEFIIPKQASVGWYQFHLTNDFANKKSTNENEGETIVWYPIKVLVSDFTPSPFKVTNQVNGDLFNSQANVEVSTQAKLHSGGAYTDTNVRITAMLERSDFTSKDPIAKDFIFSSYLGDYYQNQVFQKMDHIDNKGENSVLFELPKQNIYYGRLMFESSVQDDRGKYVSSQAYANYAGVDRFVGLKTKDWVFESGKPANIDYIVTNEVGKPVAGTKVNIAIEKQETKAAKVKSAGNSYLTEFTNHWVSKAGCAGDSQTAPSICVFNPEEPGYYRAIASIKDTKGDDHNTTINIYVVGNGHVLWSESNDYSLEIIPEKSTYKVGDKARYLIKNPYPNAQAMITVERYGVIDHFVQTLEGSTPVVEFEIKPDYIPGFYLSIVIFSPRVDQPIEGQVDLGKPSFRLGYLTVPIKDPYKEMLVTAKTDRQIYKPRDRVKLTLHAEPRFKDKKEPIEIAVAVIDESIFDLVSGGKSYFDPYEGFYHLDGLDLRNYSLLTRLVGRQKFEKKGANQGGDGGSDLAIRNLFKFVSYWNPSIQTDSMGNAQVEFEVPDNLTGWRILALAVTPSDRMGLGDISFKVNKPTEVRPVMPNQITEGDSFDAGFSVMNRTDKKRDIVVNIKASGLLYDKKFPTTLNKKITLEPYKRTTVWMPIQTKMVSAEKETELGKITFQVTAKDSKDGDKLEHALVINKRRSLETAANYGTTNQDKVEESIKFPKEIHTDVGSLSIIVSPSVIGNIDGAFKYMRDYPHSCWEQTLTKAVVASHYINLRAYMPKDFEWKDANQLPEETLKAATNFQAPNGGMAYFIPQDNYVDPYLSAYTALAFNLLKKSGYNIPEEVTNKLHGYLDNFLKHDTYPDFYDNGMASTIRAVALAALAQNGKVSLADLERYRLHAPLMSLFGKTYFLQAAMQVNGAESIVNEISKLILSHASQSGGKFTFNEQVDDSYKRILSSPLRENCVILSTFIELGERAEGKELVEDIPYKLVNMITQERGSKTHWENTQENLFCLNGLVDYVRVYENIKPNMDVTVTLDDKKFRETKFTDVKEAPVTFIKKIESTDPGRNAKATITRKGDGRLYYTTRISYAHLNEYDSYTNSGIEIKREYSVERNGKWELLKSPSELTQSELVRVDIFLSLPTARNFVVVNDPIPGGLEPVNRDLATTSIVDANKEIFKAAESSLWFKYSYWISYSASRWSFYHKELRHDSARFYSDYLPAGNYHLSYTAQAIAPGDFVIMPTYAEEMYNPDIYGRGITEQLRIRQQP